ncbi:hypothetical protein EPO34_01430 [Patescibacteria group bacterium]|nr:MAG: hypothetical protein EPO34_01430 [Patescibacteria group bacterium]
MNRRLTILTIAAAALCGFFAVAQASTQLSMMPEMDLGCLSSCIDQAMQDAAPAASLALAATVAISAFAWLFATPDLTSRFEAQTAQDSDRWRRRRLSQRRE